MLDKSTAAAGLWIPPMPGRVALASGQFQHLGRTVGPFGRFITSFAMFPSLRTDVGVPELSMRAKLVCSPNL
jgi:hypothetical protein